jgi:hypothetical protein
MRRGFGAERCCTLRLYLLYSCQEKVGECFNGNMLGTSMEYVEMKVQSDKEHVEAFC